MPLSVGGGREQSSAGEGGASAPRAGLTLEERQAASDRDLAGGPSRPSDGDAFTAEVAPHLHLLFRTALRLTHDEQAAEDLLQDTLERGFLNFARYQPGTNIRAWLLRIMSNVRISGYRRVARRPPTASLDAVEDFSMYRAVRAEGIAPADVEAVVLNRIGEAAILQAIDALPEDFRIVVVLSDVEGFSYKDMASILDVPIGTVTSRLYRGRQQLQRTLWEHAREAGYLAGARATRSA
jgi:RNA polymerase sigma-70 factor (ECF subfamily)